MKFDPYLNVDPGTMSPFQHGEVFVTDDGAETDLRPRPLRALHPRKAHPRQQPHHRRIYEQIITKERRGDYLGKTVQVIPHVTTRSKNAHAQGRRRLRSCHRRDRRHRRRHRISSLPRSHSPDAPGSRRENTCFVHVTLIPWIAAAQELKTKPPNTPSRRCSPSGSSPTSSSAVPTAPFPARCAQDRSLLQTSKSLPSLRLATSPASTRCRSTLLPRCRPHFHLTGLVIEANRRSG